MSSSTSSTEEDTSDIPALIVNGEDSLGSLTIADNDDEDDDNSDCEDEELYIESLGSCLDLFSKKTFKTAEECLAHCKNIHGLDLNLLRKRHSMDTFSFIRFVNYVRTELPSPGFVMSLSSDNKWEDVKFMKPVIPDDPVLMFNFEDEDMEEDDGEDENGYGVDISRENITDEVLQKHHRVPAKSLNPVPGSVREEDGFVTLTPEQFNHMKEKFEKMSSELELKNSELETVIADMERMKIVAQKLVLSGPESKQESKKTKSRVVAVSDARTVEEDHSYFASYAHYGIHGEMLSDKVRTGSYRDALVNNKETLSGSNILDLGCGTSILSMFAAEAGAGRVIGVDCSDVIYQAMDIVRENGYSEKITLVKGRLEETDLPVKKFDMIVSEWMGYFLLFEGMLDSVIAARDKYLSPGGTVQPSRCSIHVCAVSDPVRYSQVVEFWGDVYGYKMSCMKAPVLGEANVEVVPEEFVVSSQAKVLELDINKCSVEDTEFSTNFTLEVTKDCEVTAILGYFDTFFDLPNPVMFSTGPCATPTHWKQTIFYLSEKVSCKQNQKLDGKIICKRMKTDARALKVSLELDGKVYRYTVD